MVKIGVQFAEVIAI